LSALPQHIIPYVMTDWTCVEYIAFNRFLLSRNMRGLIMKHVVIHVGKMSST